jgi:hypothetical protein
VQGGLSFAYIRVNGQFISGLKARGFLAFITKQASLSDSALKNISSLFIRKP